MTEKQKMLAGDFYNSRDPELLELYHKTRKLLKEYNQLNSDLNTEKEAILRSLLKFKGKKVWIEAPFFCDFGRHISIGNDSFINMNCIFLDNNYITIGENALIGPNVQLYTADHPIKASERIQHSNTGSFYRTNSKPITVGKNVWIGGNSILLPGVTIGDNTTIGAGSVVTKNIPDNVLAFGNPCRVIDKI